MDRVLVILAILLLSTPLTACVTVQDINPFTPRPLTSTEVVQSQFPHIFVPKDMTRHRQRSFVNQSTPLSGCDSYTGNFSLPALGRFMQNGMTREGWTLRVSLIRADRALQMYERQGVRTVLTVTRQSASCLMDIWVGDSSTLAEWPVADTPLAGDSGSSGNSSDAPVYESMPDAEPVQPVYSGGGVQERPLP